MIASTIAHSDSLIYNPELSGLKPIVIPEPVHFAPVTPGWYILLGLLLLLALFFLYRFFRNYRANAYRRQAARELVKLKTEAGNQNPTALIEKIATILKATAMVSFSREKVARLSGQAWQEFLAATLPPAKNGPQVWALIDYQYARETNRPIRPSEIETLIDVSVKWVRRHRV